jgi:hypothetical protein
VAAFVVSTAQGAPDKLPSYAMGWPLVLSIERAAFFALVVVIFGVLARRLGRGDEVDEVGAGPASLKFAEKTQAPLEALRDAFDEDVKDLDRRLLRVERDVARGQAESGVERPDAGDG